MYQHNHIKTMTFEFIESTNRGAKGILRDTAGSKKDRDGKIAYFYDIDIKTLFTKID